MEGKLINYLLLSLVLTIVIEVVCSILIGIRKKKDVLLVVLVNMVTNPAVVFTYYFLSLITLWNLWCIKVVLEILAVVCEALYYKRYGIDMKHPIGYAILLNGISFGIGCLI